MPIQPNNSKGIGLFGVILTITGFVIGVSLFILPGQLIELAGPAVILSYLIAGSVAFFTCIVTAQVGVVIPSNGGSFVAISKLTSPFFGFMVIWILLNAVVVSTAFMAYGFANYFKFFLPQIDEYITAISVVFAFGILNIFSPKIVLRVQGLLVFSFLIAIVIFLSVSLPQFELDKITPFAPYGYSAAFLAAIAAYFSFGGFMILLELGGEIQNPSKNIPKGLAVSFGIVLTIYITVSLAIAGTSLSVPTGESAILTIVKQNLPAWTLHLFILAILAAAATSINSLILAFSRDIMVIAQSGLLPKCFGYVSKSSSTPHNAILLLITLSCIAISAESRVEELAIFAVIAVMIQQIFLAISMWRIPTKMKEKYEFSAFMLPRWSVAPISIVLILISCFSIIFTTIERPILVITITSFIILGVAYYYFVSAWMNRKGIDVLFQFQQQIDKLEKH